MTKELWTPEKVERYLAERKKNGQKMVLPKEAYVTENFSWNEVLRTQYRNIDMPTRKVLENLKTSTSVLQNYRNKVCKSITITSSWRTPSEQQELIDAYNEKSKNNRNNKNAPKGQPSATSLHLEGLAIDFVVNEVHPHKVYDYFNKNLLGELEKDSTYTHVGLPTFSEKYLKDKGLSVEKFYKKITVDGLELTPYEQSKLVKRITSVGYKSLPSTFDPKENILTYKNVNLNKPVRKPIKIEYLPPNKHETTETKSVKDTRTPSQRLNDDIREQYRRLKSRTDWRLERILGSKKSKSVSDADNGQGHWVTINGRHVFIGLFCWAGMPNIQAHPII